MNDRQTTPSRALLEDDTSLPWLRLHESRDVDGTLRLALQGELDIATAGRVRRRTRDLRTAGTPTVLDLSAVDFIDCGGLRVILEALEAADHDGWRLGISPEYSVPLRRLLELIHYAGLAVRLHGLDRLPPSRPVEPSRAHR